MEIGAMIGVGLALMLTLVALVTIPNTSRIDLTKLTLWWIVLIGIGGFWGFVGSTAGSLIA